MDNLDTHALSPVPGPEDSSESPLPWLEVLEIVFRRRWLIVLGAALGLVAAAWSISTTPPVFKATARILLGDQALSGGKSRAMTAAQIQTQMALLTSPELIREVLEPHYKPVEAAQEPDLDFNRIKNAVLNFVPNLYARLHDTPTPDPLDLRVQSVARTLELSQKQGSNVLEISYSSTNPQWTARFLNELLDRHLERIAQIDDQFGANSSFYQEQAGILEERWRGAREALAAYKAQHETDSLGGNETELRALLTRLQSDRDSAEAEATGLRARISFLKGRLATESGSVDVETPPESESTRRLKSRLVDLQIERSEMLSDFTAENPLIKDLDRQIAEVERLLKDVTAQELTKRTPSENPGYEALRVDLVQGQAQLAAAEEQVRVLTSRIADYRERLAEIEAASAELEALENEATIAKEAYKGYKQRAEEARFTDAMDESRIVDVSVLARAKPPTEPKAPKYGRSFMVGILGGLMLGFGLALLRDYWDPSVKSAAQASRLSKVRVIVEIPHGLSTLDWTERRHGPTNAKTWVDSA